MCRPRQGPGAAVKQTPLHYILSSRRGWHRPTRATPLLPLVPSRPVALGTPSPPRVAGGTGHPCRCSLKITGGRAGVHPRSYTPTRGKRCFRSERTVLASGRAGGRSASRRARSSPTGAPSRRASTVTSLLLSSEGRHARSPDTVAFRRVSRRDAVVLTGTSMSSSPSVCRDDRETLARRSLIIVGVAQSPPTAARSLCVRWSVVWCVPGAVGAAGRRGGRMGPPGRPSGRCEGHLVLVELQQVVGGGDQSPFRACGGSASSQKLTDAPVVLGLCEHRLDHHLSSSV